jgi:hypothetical protein
MHNEDLNGDSYELCNTGCYNFPMFHVEPNNWVLVEYQKHYMDQRMGSKF